jgi:hypothetical protein
MTEEVGSTLGVQVLQNGLVIGEMDEPKYPAATATIKETRAQNNIGGVMTKLVTWIDHDVLGFKVKYTGSAAQETLRTDIYDRDMDTWAVVMPPDFHSGGHSFSWSGQISKCALTEDDGVSYLDMEVTVNGRITPLTTWAAGLTTPYFSVVDDDSNALTPSPAAAGSTYEYDLEVYSDNAYIIITPTATAGTIYVNGTVVATGVASGHLTLNAGTGQVTYMSIVVTELNKTPKIYWIRCHGGPSAHP